MVKYPEDWKVVPIGDLATITTGNKNTQDNNPNGLYPFYVRSDVVERIDSYTFDSEGVITAGDGVGTGKIFHYAKGKFGLHQRAYLIHEFREDIDSHYFYWYFSRNFYERIHGMTAKSSVDSVRREMIADMPLAYPPLPEQKRIAAVLGNVDKLIDNLSRRIEKKRLVKQGVMQDLLTAKKRLPGFKGEWKRVKLGEIGAFTKGSGISRAEADSGELPAVRYGELYTNHNDYVKKYYSKISISVAKNAKLLSRGDVVFAASGETEEEIGKSAAIIDDGVYAGGDLIVFSPREKTDPIFWGFLLNIPYVQAQKTLAAQGATVVHIRTEAIASIVVNIPDVAEQKAIAGVFGAMDGEIAKLEAKLEKYRSLKHGLMNDLLTGRVRLAVSC